jgi:phosphoribosylanthranilate isomerase
MNSLSMVKVKICGITNLDDALAAVSFGADAVGFLVGRVHYSTGIFISPERVAEIVTKVPLFCSTVLVTHLSRPEEVISAARRANVSTIQLHGETTPQEAEEIKHDLPYIKVYKAVHVSDDHSIEEAQKYVGVVDGIILDTAIKETGQVGGTGKTHDWKISRKIVETVSLPVVLAGGLNPQNILEALETVHPFAVDANSGVSNQDGTKDHQKLQLFIQRAKSQ